MRQFFITMQYYCAKNKFDELLQEAAKPFNHQVIDEDCIGQIEAAYKKVEEEYRASGGRGQVEYRMNKGRHDPHHITFNFGTTYITLTAVEGYIPERTTYNRKYFLTRSVQNKGFQKRYTNTERIIEVRPEQVEQAKADKHIAELHEKHQYGVQIINPIYPPLLKNNRQ